MCDANPTDALFEGNIAWIWYMENQRQYLLEKEEIEWGLNNIST